MVQDGKLEKRRSRGTRAKVRSVSPGIHDCLPQNALAFPCVNCSEMSYLEQEAASVLVDGVIEELKEKYPSTQIAEYLEEVRHHVLDNLDPFKEREGDTEEPAPPDGISPRPERTERDPFPVYGVNVILAHGENDTCPVVFETVPTYSNLFGTIHRSYDTRGSWNSDFMDLRGLAVALRRWRLHRDVCGGRVDRNRRLSHAEADAQSRKA